FSWKATTIAFIKSASKEAIPPAIPIAFRERALAVDGGLWAGHVSRDQSCHGLAVCRCAWIAGEKARSRASCPASNGGWARAFRWDHHSCGSGGPYYRSSSQSKNCRCAYFFCLRFISSAAFASSELGGDASGLRRSDALVVRHGIGARRGTHAGPVFSAIPRFGGGGPPRLSPNTRMGIREF